MNAVICATCEKLHKDVISIPDRQAFGCASEVRGKTIVGHYGSHLIDGDVYEFARRPTYVKDGVICDTCTEKLILTGAIRKR